MISWRCSSSKVNIRRNIHGGRAWPFLKTSQKDPKGSQTVAFFSPPPKKQTLQCFWIGSLGLPAYCVSKVTEAERLPTGIHDWRWHRCLSDWRRLQWRSLGHKRQEHYFKSPDFSCHYGTMGCVLSALPLIDLCARDRDVGKIGVAEEPVPKWHQGGRGASIWDTYTGANTVGMPGSVSLFAGSKSMYFGWVSATRMARHFESCAWPVPAHFAFILFLFKQNIRM